MFTDDNVCSFFREFTRAFHDFTKHVSQACRFRGLLHYAKISGNYGGNVNEALVRAEIFRKKKSTSRDCRFPRHYLKFSFPESHFVKK